MSFMLHQEGSSGASPGLCPALPQVGCVTLGNLQTSLSLHFPPCKMWLLEGLGEEVHVKPAAHCLKHSTETSYYFY